MTIVEAIKKVLKDHPEGLSAGKVYDEIIKRQLYDFGAIDPKQVVRSKLRRHCVGLDFPSASPTKHFISDGGKGKTIKYFVWDGKVEPKEKSESARPDRLPEEVIDIKHKEHLAQVKNQMMDFIYKADPGFFEKLVIKLLQKMGYGWDDNESGIHTGGPNDEGVDGIIFLDQLGLDKVYIQAKRYKIDSPIGPGDIQRFIGSMNTKGASKGVFITSSTFSEKAIKEAGKAQLMKVELIDGVKLSDLLVKNELGVSISKNYDIYTIDTDAFLDN